MLHRPGNTPIPESHDIVKYIDDNFLGQAKLWPITMSKEEEKWNEYFNELCLSNKGIENYSFYSLIEGNFFTRKFVPVKASREI